MKKQKKVFLFCPAVYVRCSQEIIREQLHCELETDAEQHLQYFASVPDQKWLPGPKTRYIQL